MHADDAALDVQAAQLAQRPAYGLEARQGGLRLALILEREVPQPPQALERVQQGLRRLQAGVQADVQAREPLRCEQSASMHPPFPVEGCEEAACRVGRAGQQHPSHLEPGSGLLDMRPAEVERPQQQVGLAAQAAACAAQRSRIGWAQVAQNGLVDVVQHQLPCCMAEPPAGHQPEG